MAYFGGIFSQTSQWAFLEGPFSTIAGCPKQPISLNGCFPSSMGRFPTLMGRFPTLMCRFPPKTNGAKIIALHNFIVLNEFPRSCNNSLHCRNGFELIPWLCNILRCCKTYYVNIGLHYILVFKLICRVCTYFTLQNRFRIDSVVILVFDGSGPFPS